MSLERTGAWLPVLLLCLLPARPAVAEADAPQQALETVTVTATRRGERTADVAGAIGSVDMGDVLERMPDVVAEALRGEVGAFFQRVHRVFLCDAGCGAGNVAAGPGARALR